MQVKIKKLVPEAVIPFKAHKEDACFDLTATSMAWDAEMQCYIYGTGLSFEIPNGYVMHVYPRSSIRKHKVLLCNSVGTIDAGFRGEVMVSFRPTVDNTYPPYNIGERIAQCCIDRVLPVEFIESDILGDSERGTGGHGSSGN